MDLSLPTTIRLMGEPKFGLELERLWAVVLNIPAPVALLVGPQHRHELVNDYYKIVSGGGRDVTGLTAREAFPELEGQGLFEILDSVYRSGEPWMGEETPVRYDRDGTGVRETWFNLSFVPIRDESGQIFGILDFAVDVTTQVIARKEVERLLAESQREHGKLVEANKMLQKQRLALELANQQLVENSVELEAQAEELQATAAQLEESMDEAQRARTSSIAREPTNASTPGSPTQISRTSSRCWSIRFVRLPAVRAPTRGRTCVRLTRG